MIHRRFFLKMALLAPTFQTCQPRQVLAPPPPATFFVADGNSLTDTNGWNSGGIRSWLTTLDQDPALAMRGFRFHMTARAGQTTAQCLARAPEFVDLVYRPGWRNIYFLWEIINDLGHGVTVDEAYAHIVDCCKGRIAAGYEVWIATAQAASSAPYGVASFDDKRQQVNALLRANWRSFAHALIDIAAVIDANPSGLYIPDGVHLNDAGEALIAQTVRARILPILYFPLVGGVNGV